MRPALLLAALAVPAAAAAQVTPTAGQITFAPDAFLGASECDPTTSTVETTLAWAVAANNVPAANVSGGTYRVYASTRTPQDAGQGLKLCDTTDITTTTGETVRAAQVGDDIKAAANPQNQTFRSSAFAAATGYACQETSAKIIYVCVHFIPFGQTEATAVATGSLRLTLDKPAKPVITGITPGEGALRVSWEKGSGGAVDATYFKISAVPAGAPAGTEARFSNKFTSSPGRIEKLQDGVSYEVRVYAYSSADNPSEASDPSTGTPVPVYDFWEAYQAEGGRDPGGCASGPAGALGIVGAALALAVRRRRS